MRNHLLAPALLLFSSCALLTPVGDQVRTAVAEIVDPQMELIRQETTQARIDQANNFSEWQEGNISRQEYESNRSAIEQRLYAVRTQAQKDIDAGIKTLVSSFEDEEGEFDPLSLVLWLLAGGGGAAGLSQVVGKVLGVRRAAKLSANDDLALAIADAVSVGTAERHDGPSA